MSVSDSTKPQVTRRIHLHRDDGGSSGMRVVQKLADSCARGFQSLPSVPMLIGIAIGFLVCCFAGRMVSERSLFRNFLRFFQPIQPQTFFYPTASELVSFVRDTVPRDKILVLVGGASYFRGTGQNPAELWTVELQRLLGDNYKVINFAIDQAGVTDFAGAVFQVLADEYPKMIYVATGTPFANGNDGVDGGEIYRYVFWDAYYKNMFRQVSPWIGDVHRRGKLERRTPSGLEMHLGKWIDAQTFACDLWTYIGYKYFFTVWSDSTSLSPFRARSSYKEIFDPNLAKYQADNRGNKEYVKLYEERNKAYYQNGFDRNEKGQLVPWMPTWEAVSASYQELFPSDLRSKCLIVLVRPNTYFMQSFTTNDWERYALVYQRGKEIIAKLGFNVVDAGADCGPEDYIDAGHFMASGGRKIAATVASEIKSEFMVEK